MTPLYGLGLAAATAPGPYGGESFVVIVEVTGNRGGDKIGLNALNSYRAVARESSNLSGTVQILRPWKLLDPVRKGGLLNT